MLNKCLARLESKTVNNLTLTLPHRYKKFIELRRFGTGTVFLVVHN